jgi:hypothetical protein
MKINLPTLLKITNSAGYFDHCCKLVNYRIYFQKFLTQFPTKLSAITESTQNHHNHKVGYKEIKNTTSLGMSKVVLIK